jgi:hypothetical protein
LAFYNTTTNCFTNIIITQTYLVWPFTMSQLAALHKHNYNTYLVWPFTIPQLTDFVCLYKYEFWPSLCKIVRSSVILLLPLFSKENTTTSMHKSCSAHAYFDTSFAYGVYIAGGKDNNSGRNFFIIPKQTFETLHTKVNQFHQHH